MEIKPIAVVPFLEVGQRTGWFSKGTMDDAWNDDVRFSRWCKRLHQKQKLHPRKPSEIASKVEKCSRFCRIFGLAWFGYEGQTQTTMRCAQAHTYLRRLRRCCANKHTQYTKIATLLHIRSKSNFPLPLCVSDAGIHPDKRTIEPARLLRYAMPCCITSL